MDVDTQPVEADNTGDQGSQSQADPQDLSPVEQLMQRMSAHVSSDSDSADSAATDAPTEEAATDAPAKEEAPVEAEAAAEPTPEPVKDDKIELQLGRAQVALKRAQSDALTFKQEAQTLKAQVEKAAKALKDNPIKFVLEQTGHDFPTFMKKLADGEFDTEATPQFPPEIRAELDELKEFRRAEIERKQQEKDAADREQSIEVVKRDLAARAEEFPGCNAFDFVAADIVDAAYEELKAGKKPDLVAIAKHHNQMALNTVKGVLGNPKALALVANDKEVRDSIAKVFGDLTKPESSPVSSARTPAPKQTQPTRTLPTTHEVPTRTEPDRQWTREEELAESARLLRQYISAGQ